MKKNVAATDLKAYGSGGKTVKTLPANTSVGSGIGYRKTATNRSTGSKTTTSGTAKAVTKSEFNGGMKKVATSKATASNAVLKTPKTGSKTPSVSKLPYAGGSNTLTKAKLSGGSNTSPITTPGFKPNTKVKQKKY